MELNFYLNDFNYKLLEKINDVFSQKVFTKKTFIISLVVAVIASSCSKSNDEITTETQATAVNAVNLKTGHLGGQEITYNDVLATFLF